MLLHSFIFTLIASLVGAAPHGSYGIESNKIHVFKRDSALSARDLGLAEMHQVNVTEFYKHSVIKRDDNDDITIWVHNSFEPDQGPSEDPQKRQTQRVRPIGMTSGSGSLCRNHGINDQTSSQSPFSGGVKAIASWGENNRGQWSVTASQMDQWRDLVIGGSNSGRNARFRANPRSGGDMTWMGSHDVGYLARQVANRFARWFSGRERVAGYGRSECESMQWGIPIPGARNSWQWDIISTTARP